MLMLIHGVYLFIYLSMINTRKKKANHGARYGLSGKNAFSTEFPGDKQAQTSLYTCRIRSGQTSCTMFTEKSRRSNDVI